MKQFSFACLALGLVSAASAQSTVNVIGTLDMALRHVQNASGTENSVGSNGLSSSKIAFTGTEDLGGGLKAAFWLESALDPSNGSAGGSNGTATAFWNRRSTVALLGDFGELRLGRDYVPTHYVIADFDPFNTNGVANALNLLNQDSLGSGAVTQVRANNAISYFLPANLGGFSGQLMAAPGEGLKGQRYRGGRLGYAAGPWKLQVGISRTGGEGEVAFRQTNAALSYDFGLLKLVGIVNQNSAGEKKARNIELGTVVPVGANGEARLSYQHRDASGAGTDLNDAQQVALGYTHRLSKRTALYGNVARLGNQGAAAYVQTGGLAAGSHTGFSSKGVEMGIRTFF